MILTRDAKGKVRVNRGFSRVNHGQEKANRGRNRVLLGVEDLWRDDVGIGRDRSDRVGEYLLLDEAGGDGHGGFPFLSARGLARRLWYPNI
jgi:hypothetical protein